ncbi:MAG: hypothetical protein ACJATT_000655 [Myxococcota bacterium]|jgi:hypothetical protein
MESVGLKVRPLDSGTDAVVGGRLSICVDTALAAMSFVEFRVTWVGRVNTSAARPVGAGAVLGRRTDLGADYDIAADNTFGCSTDVGQRRQTEANVSVGYAATWGMTSS